MSVVDVSSHRRSVSLGSLLLAWRERASSILLPSCRQQNERFGWWQALVTVLAAVVISLWRVRGALDRIWAEDWLIYLRQPTISGCQPIEQYAGYEQLPARLVGCLVSEAPLQYWAWLMAASAALLGALCCLAVAVVVWQAGVRKPQAIAVGFVLVLNPTAQLEVLDNMANLAWIALPSMLLMLLWVPRSGRAAWFAALLLFLGAADTAVAFVLFPLALARLIVLPLRSGAQIVTGGFIAGAVLQLFVVLGAAGSRPVPPTPGLSVITQSAAARIAVAPLGFTVGEEVFQRWQWVAIVPMLVLLLIVMWFSGWPARVLLFFAVILQFFLLMRQWFPGYDPGTGSLALGAGGRYLASSAVLVIFAGLLATLGRKRNPAAVAVTVAMILVAGIGIVADFRVHGVRSETGPWPDTVSAGRLACAKGATEATLVSSPNFAGTLPVGCCARRRPTYVTSCSRGPT